MRHLKTVTVPKPADISSSDVENFMGALEQLFELLTLVSGIFSLLPEIDLSGKVAKA